MFNIRVRFSVSIVLMTDAKRWHISGMARQDVKRRLYHYGWIVQYSPGFGRMDGHRRTGLSAFLATWG